LSDATKNHRLASNSPEETHALGVALGRVLVGEIVIGLVGQLGAGKTHFVKGLAVGNALCDDRAVTSPTFTLINEYAGRLTLYHLDAYRLTSVDQFVALGFDELLRGDSAVVVEWADRVRPAMPDESLWLTIEPVGETQRTFDASATGRAPRDVLEAWINAVR